MRSPLLGALLLLTSARAAAAPTPVTSAKQLAGVCTDFRGPLGPDAAARRQGALAKEWVVRLGPGQFHIAHGDPRSGTLSLSTEGGLRPFGGHAVLTPVDEDDFDLTLAEGQSLPPNPDALTLEVVFRLGEAAEPPCSIGLLADVAMGIEVLEARLLASGDKVVATLDADALADRPTPPGGKPAVDVDAAEVEGSSATSDRLTEAVRGLQPRLVACFEHALTGNPSLDGLLVLSFPLGHDGHVGALTVVADSVQDEGMSKCVIDLVKAVTVHSAPAGTKAKKAPAPELVAGRASVTLRFERR